jgi:hypothetical protein
MKYLFFCVLMVTGLTISGCNKSPAPAKKSEKTTTKKGNSETNSTTKASTTPKPVKAGRAASKAKEAGEKAVPKVFTKELLATAYVEIYCARQAGGTEAVFNLFKKYGFDSPAQWGTAWKKVATDKEWIIKLNQRAVALCPPKTPVKSK